MADLSQRQFRAVQDLIAVGIPRDEAISQVLSPVGSAPTGFVETDPRSTYGPVGQAYAQGGNVTGAPKTQQPQGGWTETTTTHPSDWRPLHPYEKAERQDTGTGMIERTDGAPYKGSTSGLHADKYLANFEARWGVPVKELTDAVGWSPIQKALSEGKSFRAATPEWGDTPWDNYHEAVSDGLRERVPGLFVPENQEKIWEDLLFIKQKSDEAMAADPDWPRRYDELQ